jgi:DNA repair protein SbcC/Rad50
LDRLLTANEQASVEAFVFFAIYRNESKGVRMTTQIGFVPLTLKLWGFIGLAGREVFLDLSGPAQLIALVGPNGAGKSTVLDNLHPYLTMPSRASAGGGFWGHVMAPDAGKELVWSLRGVFYKTFCSFKQSGKNKKAEYFLYQGLSQSGPWEPCATLQGVQSDGKEATYLVCLDVLLPSELVFTSCAFAAQGKRIFSAWRAGDLRALFGQLVDTKQLPSLLEKAKANRQQAHDCLVLARAKIAQGREASDRMLQRQAALGQLNAQLTSAKGEERRLVERLNTAQLKLASMQARIEQEAKDVALRSSLELALEQRLATIHANAQAVRVTIERRIAESTALIAKGRRRQVQLQLERAVLRAQLRAGKRYETNKAVLAARREEVLAERKLHEALVAQMNTDFSQDEKLSELVSAANRAQATAQINGQLLLTLREQYTRALQVGALAKRVPCAQLAIAGQCELLKNSLEANEQLPELKAKGIHTAAAVKELNATAGELANNVELEQRRIQQHRQQLQRQMSDAQAALSKHDKVLADIRQAAEFAEQKESLASARLTKLRAALEERGSLRSLREQLADDANSLAQCKHKLLVDLEEASISAQAQLKLLPPTLQVSELASAKLDYAGSQAHVVENNTLVELLRSQATTLQAQLDGDIKLVSELPSLEEKVEFLQTEIADWILLESAFGPAGIAALLVDSVGPTICAIANQMLAVSHGSRFSLELATQRETASGSLSETLEPLVLDAATGQTCRLAEKSGGERVWLDGALARAICVYLSNQASGVFGAFLSDESDGPLDEEHKVGASRMRREALRMGGMQKEIFVSHSPEVIGSADLIIEVDKL